MKIETVFDKIRERMIEINNQKKEGFSNYLSSKDENEKTQLELVNMQLSLELHNLNKLLEFEQPHPEK